MGMLRPAFRLLSLSSGSYLPKAGNQQAFIVLATSSRLFLPVSPRSSVQASRFRSFTSSTPPNPDRLSWDEFLRLRRQRRLSGVIASVPSSMLGIYGGVQYFGSGEIDPTQTILGFDPIMMNAIFVLGCGVMGWLIGPTVGRGVWHVLHRRQALLINEREPQFFKHIEKNRADPSFQSYSNPVPDYYGEKIGSLKDYRRWLRDQRAYRKKAQTFL